MICVPGEVPDLILERFLLAELPPSQQQALAEQVAADPGLRQRVQALKESNQSLLRQYPAAWIGRQLSMRTAPLPASGPGWWAWTRVWLVPAVAALVILVSMPQVLRHGMQPGTRSKGLEPQLQLFRRSANGAERLADSSQVRPGDRLQLVYVAAGDRFGAILSVDGRGVQTQHLPTSGGRAVALRQGRADTLGFSYELDAAPDCERFYFITADAPFDLAVVRRAVQRSLAAEAGPRLSLPADLRQQVCTLIKVSKR